MNAARTNPVGRPRGFDEEEVLLTMMDVFWRKGYEATSMSDLLAATGLHKGSLYQAFGDKHSLFIRALRAYVNELRSKMAGILQGAESGIEGLREAMYYHIEVGVDEGGANMGCMALNTLVETAPHDPEVMAVLRKTHAGRLQLIGEAVSRAQAEGDLRPDWAPERLAHLLAAFEAGVIVELKGPLDEAGAKTMVDDMLASLG